MGNDKASQIPDFGKYRSKSGTKSNLVFQYFMVGTMGALTAAGAKATVQGKFCWDGKGTWGYGRITDSGFEGSQGKQCIPRRSIG
jgi:hypothetical protein